MACTPQELVNAAGCFNGCLSEFHADVALTVLICIGGGGNPPSDDIYVIGGEDGDILSGEGGSGEMIGSE